MCLCFLLEFAMSQKSLFASILFSRNGVRIVSTNDEVQISISHDRAAAIGYLLASLEQNKLLPHEEALAVLEHVDACTNGIVTHRLVHAAKA
jgi:hypothetical protein